LRENYKLGVQFGFPLLLRKERGSLQLADLKILDARYGRSQKQLEIENKISVYQNEIRTLRQQLQTAIEMRDNYARLLAGENEKFAIGESSLFLVNSRENKLIEANLKLLKLQVELAKSAASLRWAAGLLN
jgi:outer membrane protein TolC